MEDKNEASAFNKENEDQGSDVVKTESEGKESNEKIVVEATVELPPADYEQTPTRSQKKPSILMKENETSEQKTGVCFDETQNNVVEFAKNEKINRGFKNIQEMETPDEEISLRGPNKA